MHYAKGICTKCFGWREGPYSKGVQGSGAFESESHSCMDQNGIQTFGIRSHGPGDTRPHCSQFQKWLKMACCIALNGHF